MRMASVALITVTPDAEELLVYMARVSNPVNQGVGQRSERLIQYLIDHKHWSPFEMVHMVLQIETTRSVAAQGGARAFATGLRSVAGMTPLCR